MGKNVIKTNILIAVVIIIGFCSMEISTDISFKNLFMRDIEYVSDLTSESMYMGIENIMSRPINVSLSMANDTFLREFMLTESATQQTPEHIDTIRRYLAEYQVKNKFDSAFLVSRKTGNYYHYKNGIDRVMSRDEPEDAWYYSFLDSPREYALNVDNDQAHNNQIAIFVNCKLTDRDGNTMGIVGVGLDTPYVQQLMADNEKKYQIKAYLIDSSGQIKLSANFTEFEGVNIFDNSAFRDIKNQIISNTTSTEKGWYTSGRGKEYFVTRYIPYMNWYLVVEKSTDELYRNITRQLCINSIVMLLALGATLSIVTFILRKYNKILVNIAERDHLTGVRNRTAYEYEIKRYNGKLNQYKNFGICIFDLNNLKTTNDQFGHMAGDEYISVVSSVLCEVFEHSPVFRMGGDEFCVILINMDENQVLACCENMTRELEVVSEKYPYPMSVAFGYAFYDHKNLDMQEKIFSAADSSMYETKKRQKTSN